MSISDAGFALRAERIAQEAAERRQLEEAKLLCGTIVGNEDGHWLLRTLTSVRSKGSAARMSQPRCFQFMGDSPEAVIRGRSDESQLVGIHMPADGVVRKLRGVSYSTWEFQVENASFGDEYESIIVAFRKVGHDQLLYLKSHQRGQRTYSGRRAGSRTMGRGPDRSL